MKTKTLLLVGLIVALWLTACGGSTSGDEPVAVVEKVVDAMETLDVDAATQYICEAQKSELQGSMTAGLDELEALGLNTSDLLDAFGLKFDNLKYDEKEKSDDSAVVNVQGSMTLDFDTDKLKDFFRQAAEASGETVTDEQLDFVVGMFSSMAGQEIPIDGDIKVVKEDGKWLVCDDLGFLENTDLFNLP